MKIWYYEIRTSKGAIVKCKREILVSFGGDKMSQNKSSRKISIHFVILVSFAIISTSTKGSVTFSDGNFQESDWEVISEEWGNGGSVTSETRQSGGNPGAFMRILTSVNAAPPQSCIAGVFLCASAIYNPAERGAIQTFDYSESSIMIYGFGQGQATSLAIRQNGRIYYAGLGHANRGLGHANILKWTQNSFTGLTSEDFGRPYESTGHHPDFSEKAPPLQFGFYRLNSTPSFSYSRDAGIDNWSVTIHNKPPEASSLQVIIEPQEAVDAGALWRRAGTLTWYDSGHIETGLSPGQYTVEFSDVPGYVTPDEQTETLELQDQLHLVGSYFYFGSVTFSDGVFNTSDWQLTIDEGGNGGSVSFSQESTGGNPDEYLRITDTVNAAPPYSNIAGVFFNINAIYFPRTQGEIVSLEYSEDSVMFQGWGSGQTAGLALRQNGIIYYAHYPGSGMINANRNSWTHYSSMSLNAENFGHWYVPNHPDFSSKGSPIEFGFYRGNSTPSFSYSITAGIDNWSVTIQNEQLGAGSLQVIIEPQEAVDAGAKWRRVGTAAWHDSGHIETGIPIGEHIVQFKDVPGYIRPDDRTEMIDPNSTLYLTAIYLPTDTEPIEPGITHVFYDDFVYAESSDPELSQFGWRVRTSPGGPGVEGAQWTSDQVTFVDDPNDEGDRLLIMGASTSGTPASSQHSEIMTDDFFLEGTYAARVRLTDTPVYGPDVNDIIVQAFFSINELQYDYDFSYSECDFEYLPNGGWGASQPTMFVTSWATYKPEYPPDEQVSINQTDPHSVSLDDGQWHILRFEISDRQVKYFIDDTHIKTHSGIYYPESEMSIALQNWFGSLMSGSVNISGSEHRQYEFYVDWVFHAKDSVLNDTSIENLISEYRLQGHNRLNTIILQTTP